MAEFDAYADSYELLVEHSTAFVGKEIEYFARRKADHLLDMAARLVGLPAELTMLDVGCGIGAIDSILANRVGTLHGVDTAPEAVQRAASRNPNVDYKVYDGGALPYANESVDIAFAICVVHHVDACDRHAFITEMRRVVRFGGAVVIFEHNPFNPLTRLAVSRCEFDKGVVLLTRRAVGRLFQVAGMRVIDSRYILFTTSDRLRSVDRVFSWLPLGAQHYVAARREK
jgi:ubiquinone/menaquinone biosynthesis C-methylase UbiE